MVLENVAQLGPMLVLAGLVVGWVSEAARHSGGRGFLADLGIALVGSIIGGVIVWSSISTALGMLAMFGIGCGGGAQAIIVQRTVWPSNARGPKAERVLGARSGAQRPG
jgi:hypothetical protein